MKQNPLGPVVMALAIRPFSIAIRARRTSIRFLGWSSILILYLIFVLFSLEGSDRTDISRILPSWEDDSTSLSIKSSRLIGSEVLDLFFGSPRLDCEDFACSLRMMLSEGRCKKGKERVIFLYILNLVDLLKSLVATAYVDCTAYALCKRLCVEYTTFACIATYSVRIVRLVRVSDLLRTYTACTLEATLCVRCTSVRVSDLMRT